jgi:hypothetical protein
MWPNAQAHLLQEAGARHERTLEAVRCSALLAPPDQPVVVVVSPNPHPQEILTVLDRSGSMRQPDPGRPHVADFLELQ